MIDAGQPTAVFFLSCTDDFLLLDISRKRHDMAEDIKRVIEVDATSSSKTIRELREEIEKLKKTLSELTAGTKEFAEAQARMRVQVQQSETSF